MKLLHLTSSESIFEKQKNMFLEATLLVRLFYLFTFMFLLGYLGNWESLSARPQLVSSWPANWIWKTHDPKLSITLVLSAALIFNLISSLFPFNLFSRLIACFSTQIYLSYHLAVNGYNNHSYYGLTIISLIFLTLPTSHAKMSFRSVRYQTNATLWLSSGALVTIYFLIGLGNLRGGISQQMREGISIFNPISIVYFILDELQESHRKSVLFDFIFKTYFVFWLGLFVVLFKKLSGPFIWLMKPKYLPVVGVGFILFHLFNAYAFGLPFGHLTFQVGVFLVLNPTHQMNSKILSKKRLKKYYLILTSKPVSLSKGV